MKTSKTKINNLEIYRKNIDFIDNRLIKLLAERMKVVKKIGQYKKRNRLPPLDKDRWSRVIKTKTELGKKFALSPKFIKDIYNRIHKESLKLQEKI